MKEYIQERAIQIAQYIVETGATVRDAAKIFCVSKSTAHKDVTDRLIKMNSPLYSKVKLVLDTNKAERHLRGGIATCNKYKNR